ncbi:hypothetical protein H696_00019 [Fonticula alba]|uniref:R-spondin Fu-CRD domain-containing protein n=1 Tax=Fonticula alba TaxID=691883 RepID=A0A058ZG38_FONAL|nr:hypothetical protein H696_00019 [Fonticula alba]KCV72432.1 hypothetical protein H696_00019 [Fonticula alba]|eukprot:XP_009492133.1 hypothetical protein H696_00019 [Fonticula alba]
MVEGYAYLPSELPDRKLVGGELLPQGPEHCWQATPGNSNLCDVCRHQAAPNGKCRPAVQPVTNCTALAHEHINEDCSSCAWGNLLTPERRCISSCYSSGRATCGNFCFPPGVLPDGFSCAAWAMRDNSQTQYTSLGHPSNHHLLKCSRPGFCIDCHDSCEDCVGPGDRDCLRCPAGRMLLVSRRRTIDGQRIYAGTCIRGARSPDGGDHPSGPMRCPPTTADIGNNMCVPCAQGCHTCGQPATSQCQQCMRGLFLIQGGRCWPSCPAAGTFKDSLTGRCVACSVPGCGRCPAENPGVCTACADPAHKLHQNACVGDCPPGMFPLAGACVRCPAECRACTSLAWCTECAAGFFGHEGRCLPLCGPGRLWDSTVIPGTGSGCDTCHPSCASCLGSTGNCLACGPGRRLVLPSHPAEAQACTLADACPAGYYPSGGQECRACLDPNCQDCPTAERCSRCRAGFSLFGDLECFASCPEGYHSQGGVCVPCAGDACAPAEP